MEPGCLAAWGLESGSCSPSSFLPSGEDPQVEFYLLYTEGRTLASGKSAWKSQCEEAQETAYRKHPTRKILSEDQMSGDEKQ